MTNIPKHGLWLLVMGEELFVSSKEFLWFKDVTEYCMASASSPVYWQDLDVENYHASL
ncbi:hypothetical protein [Nitrospira sp. BLG_1]|uniref:hypothetical protein n=1 Tax=Nitrospira sp. BLG_1 TaxID=3395883 RepID=UPI0039BC9CB5